ncbi:hypothetical protein PTI98_008325 [Pleurotus ostreatus]|nr:hypothetical protein PTI98_008325 [Pleurotus ostreatus]
MLSLSSSLYRTTRRSGSVGMRASEGGTVVVGEKKVKASDRPLIFDALSGTTFPGPLLSLGAPSAIVETICGGERCTSSPIQSLRTDPATETLSTNHHYRRGFAYLLIPLARLSQNARLTKEKRELSTSSPSVGVYVQMGPMKNGEMVTMKKLLSRKKEDIFGHIQRS